VSTQLGKQCKFYIKSVVDPYQAFEGAIPKVVWTIVACHTKIVTFCRPKSGYFCWSNYAISQDINHSLKALYTIPKTFQTGPKQWASFFTSYTYLEYLQNVFKRCKACCAQAFATVLAIRSDISEEQCLKRNPDLVRSITVLLRLGSDNSCLTIGL